MRGQALAERVKRLRRYRTRVGVGVGIVGVAIAFVVPTGVLGSSAADSYTPPGPPGPPGGNYQTAAITVDPVEATNPLGTTHTMTATVTFTSGGSAAGTSVVFFVLSRAPAPGFPPDLQGLPVRGTCTANAQGQCSFTYTGPVFTPARDQIVAFADLNGSGTFQGLTEPSAIVFKNWVIPGASSLTLDPADATNLIGQRHTVTATASDGTNKPVSDVTVRFSVTGSVNASGSCVSDTAGQCSFSYAGPRFPGNDEIAAFADTNGNGIRDGNEPATTAIKRWVLPPSTHGHARGHGALGHLAFTFIATTEQGLSGSCDVSGLGHRVLCSDVTTFLKDGNGAWIYGNATDNGVSTLYRIHVVDGETDRFEIFTPSGLSAGSTLTGGNVSVG